MIRRIGLLSLGCIAVAITSLHAQDTLSDDDAFSSGYFDQTISSSTVREAYSSLEYLPGFTIVSDGDAVARKGSGYGSSSRFYGTAFLKASKADIGALYTGCNFNYFLYAAANDSFMQRLYRYQSPDPATIDARLSEFHFSFDIQKRLFIRVGKQLIAWGASYFWSPEDFINQTRAQADILTPVDIRTGKPGLRLHLPFKNINIFLFTDFSRITRKFVPQPIGQSVGQAWRIDGTFAGINIGTVGYVTNGFPAHIGFDATGNISGVDLYGEIAIIPNDHDETVSPSLSIGASRLFGKEKNWTVRGEIYYNDTGYTNVNQSSLPRGSFTPFYSGKQYVYAELTGKRLIATTVDCSLFGIVNVADGSYSTTLQFTIDLPGVIPFTLYTRYYGGVNDREFTTLYGGSAWQGGLRIMVAL